MPAAAEISRIGLIGDVHAQHALLEATLSFFARAGVDCIVCTGDLADGTGSLDVCCDLLDACSALVVAGNHDRWLTSNRMRNVPQAHQRGDVSEESLAYLARLPATRKLRTTVGDVLLCHGVADNDLRKVWPGSPRMPAERSPELDSIIADGDTRLVLNGHTHYRVIVNFEVLTLINAGTLKGEHRPGVSILDLDDDVATAFEFDANLGLGAVAEHRIHDPANRRVWKDTQEFDGRWNPVVLYRG